MAVPPEIRSAERPRNTIVEDRGKDGPKRYAVRECSSIKYISGKNPQPHNGKVIGHIINGKYVPLVKSQTPEDGDKPDMLSYGSSSLIKSVSDDLLENLLKVYDPVKAYKIMAIASLKVMHPGITAKRISAVYNMTFISVYYPRISFSQKSLGALYDEIGADISKLNAFFKHRIKSAAPGHHLAIDSALKNNTTTVNDLSSYSCKAKKSDFGIREYLVIYAYDIENREPICSEMFSGNCRDISSYTSFIKDNDINPGTINSGIILANKGFTYHQIRDALKNSPGIRFLAPIKRNDKRIANNGMLEFQGVLDGISENVRYCKKKIKNGNYLYAFRDADLAAQEETAKLIEARNNKDYNDESFSEKEKTFGLTVWESDSDLEPLIAYKTYAERWLPELIFKRYNSDECLELPDNQGTFSITGSEFVNFISAVITARILKKFENTGLLKELSFADIMDDLASAWRKTNAPLTLPDTKDAYWVHTSDDVFAELEKLGLSKPLSQSVSEKTGRLPKKSI